MFSLIFSCILIFIAPSMLAVEEPTFTDASVHDPSVLYTNHTYYVFGSHLAAAKTNNLMNWEQIEGDGVHPGNSLFEDVTKELEEALTWAKTDTLWAPDMIQLKSDGKYYMYYNACEGSSPRSAMGIAVANHPEGPYQDLGLILRSGMTAGESATIDGTPYDDAHFPEIYDATIHPNVVDPDVFYDEEGKLWMVYGSYSGGIFILELDPDTGFPIPNQGYGKKLLGGNHSRIEAPYIVYNKTTDYYYLYLSYGGLASDGGYNVRVARSENPDGPYTDIQGNNMIQAKGEDGTFFDDESIAPTGTKLIGNYEFEKLFGETGEATGYVSPGHNSVYYDEKTGQQFLIFHTRFPNRGEAHEIRVHQILMNEKGWPVVAPFRYVTDENVNVTKDEIAGDYKYIAFQQAINADITKSTHIKLTEDGAITGDVSGTWEFKEESNLTLSINGETFNGIVMKQWDPVSQSETVTFTALANNGLSVWGSRYEMTQYTDSEITEMIAEKLEIGDPSQVMEDLHLPTKGEQDTIITWKSSNTNVLSHDGKINRPAYKKKPVSVELTATIEKGSASTTKQFNITIIPETFKGLAAHYSFEGNLHDRTNRLDAGTVTGDRINNTGGNITFVDGKIGNAAKFDGKSGIKLPNGIIDSNTYTVSIWLKPVAYSAHTTSFFGAASPEQWISLLPGGTAAHEQTMLWSGSKEWYEGLTEQLIPLDEWSHIAFTVTKGNLNLFINGEHIMSLTNFPHIFTTTDAVFALGINYWDLPYEGLMDEVLIYNNKALSAEDIEHYYRTQQLPINTTELEEKIKEAKDLLDGERYTETSLKKLTTTIEQAEASLTEMKSEAQLTQMLSLLQSAIDGLKVRNDQSTDDYITISSKDQLFMDENGNYIVHQEGKSYLFKAGVFDKGDIDKKIAITYDSITVFLPVENVMNEKGSLFTFGDVSKAIQLKNKRVISDLVDFTLEEDGTAIELKGPIEISFSIEREKVKNWESVRGIYIDENGEQMEVIIPKSYDEKNGIVTILVNHLSIYGILELTEEQHPSMDHDESATSSNDKTETKESSSTENRLPDTATNQFSWLFAGALLLFSGFLLITVKQIRKDKF